MGQHAESTPSYSHERVSFHNEKLDGTDENGVPTFENPWRTTSAASSSSSPVEDKPISHSFDPKRRSSMYSCVGGTYKGLRGGGNGASDASRGYPSILSSETSEPYYQPRYHSVPDINTLKGYYTHINPRHRNPASLGELSFDSAMGYGKPSTGYLDFFKNRMFTSTIADIDFVIDHAVKYLMPFRHLDTDVDDIRFEILDALSRNAFHSQAELHTKSGSWGQNRVSQVKKLGPIPRIPAPNPSPQTVHSLQLTTRL
ncbi:hypothetical protein P154DRAFT_530119 [Amniculicola lignicola CBS 123094]|uniref:Uncharacterized protein n=1 Tax=Amniculicola lignicola CBS 123094 TaxID=1392246 RepID=A0A6A5WXV4_9PLEO|nr:hypothetical protein P154DRAFT_530119 [Amniculicola lignicola CBS 123094]